MTPVIWIDLLAVRQMSRHTVVVAQRRGIAWHTGFIFSLLREHASKRAAVLRALLFAALASLAIETAKLFLQARLSSLLDVIGNVSGSVAISAAAVLLIGVALPCLQGPHPGGERRFEARILATLWPWYLAYLLIHPQRTSQPTAGAHT